MKKVSAILTLAALCSGIYAAGSADPTAEKFRQVYDLKPEKVREYTKQMTADLAKHPAWKNAPAFYYVVPAMSDIPRQPDTYPADGTACGDVRFVATPGEFEPASLVIAPLKNVDAFTLKASDLKNEAGNVLPASAFDIKMVKVWYQAGSAWYGYFADALGRVRIPELLLNDENLIRSVDSTKDNYVRYSNRDGSTTWQWMSANFMVTNYRFSNQANIDLIADAPTLQPVVLNKNEFKQYFVTVKVPADAKGGLYTGALDLVADGKVIGKAPVVIRVLPFTLPDPKTNYNQDKKFFLSMYGSAGRNPRILKNLADHNAKNPMGFPSLNVFAPEQTQADIKLAKECGIDTDTLLSGAQGVGVTVYGKREELKGENLRRIERLEKILAATNALSMKLLGHTNYYSYGVDEGGPATIRAERIAWKAAHDNGGKVMVSSGPHKELIYALDYLVQPGAPAPGRIKNVNDFHESNPAGLCGWYANPHTGPENPDYFRRVHGFQSYKSNYDVAANYTWWRNNWNDMATPYEQFLRGLVLVYATRDSVLDTITWEGVREGFDDVKYASYLKRLALEASANKNGDVLDLGRRNLAWLAYTDEEHCTLDTFRLECINRILQLRKALNKGNGTL